jgi:hypothetical protein
MEEREVDKDMMEEREVDKDISTTAGNNNMGIPTCVRIP